MRAVQITAFGGPEILAPVELPDPRPGPGEVLVEVARPASTTSTPTSAAAPTRSTCRSCRARRERAGCAALGEGDTGGFAVGDRVAWANIPAATPNAWPCRPTPPSPCRTASPTTSPSAPSCRA